MTASKNGKGRATPSGTARGGSALRTVEVPRVVVSTVQLAEAYGRTVRAPRPGLEAAFLSGGGTAVGRAKGASTATVRRFVAAPVEALNGPGVARDAFLREHGEAGFLLIPAERERWDGLDESAEAFAPSFVRKARAHGWAVEDATVRAAMVEAVERARKARRDEGVEVEVVREAARSMCAARWVLGHGVGAASAGSKSLRAFVVDYLLGGKADGDALDALGVLDAARSIYAAGTWVEFGPGVLDSAPFGGCGMLFG